MQDALRTLLAMSVALTCACQSEAPPSPMDTAKADTFPGEASRSEAETRLPDDASVEPMGETQGSREPDGGQRSSEARPWEPPQPDFIHVTTHPPLSSASESFEGAQVSFVEDPLTLPHLDVRVLVDGPEGLWLGTSGGLYLKPKESDFYLLQPSPTAEFLEVRDISRELDASGRRAVLFEGWVQWVRADDLSPEALPLQDTSLRSIALTEDTTWLGGDLGVVRLSDGFESSLGGVAGPVRDLAIGPNASLWIASQSGVYRLMGEELTLIASEAATVLLGHTEGVWSGDDEGVSWFGELGEVTRYPAGIGQQSCTEQVESATCTACVDCEGHDLMACATCGDGFCAPLENGAHCPADCGLPAGDIRSLDYRGGALAIAHPIGVTLLRFGEHKRADISDHYAGARWLVGSDVQAVALTSDALEVATNSGLSRIMTRERRLSEDAEALEELLDEHFWRMEGFVAPSARLDDPRDPSSYALSGSLDDGLNTQLQVAAWCFAHAATGQERFYTQAKRALDTLLLLVDLPGKDFASEGEAQGFIARSLVRDDEGDDFTSKAGEPGWHRVSWTDDRDYYWAGGTRSEDLAAHFFGFSLFFDLCAQSDLERMMVTQRVSAITKRLIASNYALLGLDGLPTPGGPWPPERVTAALDGLESCDASEAWCEEAWFGGAWLKSLQTLSQLLSSYHMSGDLSFYRAYEELITEHRYDEVALAHPQTHVLTCPGGIDARGKALAMLAYTTLIRYEADPERRAQWQDALRYMLRWAELERHPLWSALTALLEGEQGKGMERALRSLREIAPRQQNWTWDNGHRRDVKAWPDDLEGQAQLDRVLAYDEIGPVTFGANLHRLGQTGDGLTLEGPTLWLLTYYAMRYAGVITE